MNTFQKVIKYVALAFGIALAIAIIEFGLNIGYIVLQSTNLIHNNTKISNVNFGDYSSYLDIDLKVANLVIKRGDTLRYETNINGLASEQENNKLSIKDTSSNIFRFNNNYITLYVPDNIIFDKVVINMGVGELEVDDVSLNNAEFKLGVGEANIRFNLSGNTKIDCGVGEVNLDLSYKEEDYTFKLDKGIGEINVNNKSYGNTTFGNGKNYIDIDGGIGEINIKTR